MKDIIYRVRYRYKTSTSEMTGISSFRWNGFAELLDIEKELKKDLKKFRFKLIEIEDIQKIEE